jgi:hypothetical protein
VPHRENPTALEVTHLEGLLAVKLSWRATNDDDEHYVYAIALYRRTM